MLTISEEILLLMLDDETGWLSVALPGHRIRAAISGAVLMDLALADRIDTDLEHLFLVNPEPAGEPALDHALERIRGDEERRPVDHWVDVFTRDHEAVRARIGRPSGGTGNRVAGPFRQAAGDGWQSPCGRGRHPVP